MPLKRDYILQLDVHPQPNFLLILEVIDLEMDFFLCRALGSSTSLNGCFPEEVKELR